MQSNLCNCAINLHKIFQEIIFEEFKNINYIDNKDIIEWIIDDGSKQCAIQVIKNLNNCNFKQGNFFETSSY